MCRAITQGNALDMIEIDAASNRGIDEIRELRERVNFAPNIARYKVYIIDEVHMLTDAASNALLKTLEEPPSHAIFVLATTEPHKMLPTILSRCQRFDFRRLSQAAVGSKLTYICEKEGIHIEPAALRLIASAAAGSLRDAENLLQQICIYYGDQIDIHQVEDVLGVTADFRVGELARHIINKDVAAGLATINSITNDGLDLGQFKRGLVEHLRNMLLIKSGAEGVLDIVPEDLDQVKELTDRAPLEDILKAVKLFGQIDFRFGGDAPLPLELALVECALPEAEGKGAISPEAGEEREIHPEEEPKGEDIVVSAAPSSLSHEAETLEQREEVASEDDPKIKYIRAHWNDFVETLRGMGSSGNLDAFLRSACEPVAIEDDTLVLGFYFSFHKEKIENPKYRHMVEKKLGERFGTPNKISCILREKTKQRAMEGHLVKAALEMGGRVTSVEEK
jgi:DNA polymerase-3 subunit gamma/tau